MKILDAALQLLGEVGPFGLTLAMAAERADVSRALPTYQFRTRQELLAATTAAVLEVDIPEQDLGLEPLLTWMRRELEAAAVGGRGLRARLALVMGPTDTATQEAVAAYWSARSGLVQRHLERGQVLQQIRSNLDAVGVATALLGQLHGEMTRVARGLGPADADAFLTLTRAAIAATGPAGRQAAKPPVQDQPQLF